MKRNSENKYRMKIIQELHLKKDKQKELDECIRAYGLTYAQYYNCKNGIVLTLTKAFKILAKSIANAASVFCDFCLNLGKALENQEDNNE